MVSESNFTSCAASASQHAAANAAETQNLAAFHLPTFGIVNRSAPIGTFRSILSTGKFHSKRASLFAGFISEREIDAIHLLVIAEIHFAILHRSANIALVLDLQFQE